MPGNIAIFGRVEIKQVDWADPEVEAKPGKVPEYNTLQQCKSTQEKVFVVSNVQGYNNNIDTAVTRCHDTALLSIM